MAKRLHTLDDFKERIQATFDNNAESLAEYGINDATQLKVYLLETNVDVIDKNSCPHGCWRPLDSSGWYRNEVESKPAESNTFFLHYTKSRVLRVYSILDATPSDALVKDWVSTTRGLDYCWLTRDMLMSWSGESGWEERGLGFKFEDGLTPESERGNFSLKAWHGANKFLGGLDEILEKAKAEFAISSVRWQKRVNGNVEISAEWYSNGKVTFNKAADIDDVLAIVTNTSIRYDAALTDATEKRDTSLAAFEIGFCRDVDLDKFSSSVSRGATAMRLWLVETSSEVDFRRFKGVDLHTWDRIFLDVGPRYAFLTIPGKGCVNAAPRLATIQGEDNAGRTSLLFDGVEIFA